MSKENIWGDNYMLQKNNNTESDSCQDIIFKKLIRKKYANKDIIEYLESINRKDKAIKINDCATQVGVTSENGIAKIVKANFCRERLCNICAWRRQAKFIAQAKQLLNILGKDYQFIFVTLTIKNCGLNDLEQAVDQLLYGWNKLNKQRKISRSWVGSIRSLELSYNHITNTFHPHIHTLVAVRKNYFDYENYISLNELIDRWQIVLGVDYKPNVDIKKTYGDDETDGAIETIKYSLKPSKYREALEGFYTVLSGRRLISFSGVFFRLRKELKLADYDSNLLDEVNDNNKKISFDLYTFDVSGGYYRFNKTYELGGD